MNDIGHYDCTFQEAIATIERSIHLLERSHEGVSMSLRTSENTAASTSHARRQLSTLRSDRPDRACVLILGEFKAGKSTLVNALIGRPVAAVDVFEMTSAVCRIVPLADGPEGVELSSSSRSRPKMEQTLEEFLKLCREHKLDGYTQATMRIKSLLDVVLIDTPGLGANLENEINAVDALATTDVVLWTVDGEHIGGAREAAMLAGIRERAIPLACALTKCDIFDSDEVAETVEYITQTFGIEAGSIFPVSAHKSLEAGSEYGLDRLREYLQTEVAPSRALVREMALRGQAIDIAGEVAKALGSVIESLNSAQEQINEYSNAMASTAQVVTDDICGDVTARLKDKLVDEFIGRVRLRIDGSSDFKTLSEDDIVEPLRQSMESVQGEAFWRLLIDQVESRIQKDWSDGIRLQVAALLEQLKEAQLEADGAAAKMAEDLVATQLYEAERRKVAVRSGLEAATTFIATTILTFNPFVGLLFASPSIYNWWTTEQQRGQSMSDYEIELQLRQYATEWAHSTVTQTVEKHLKPKLYELNLIVASQAADTYSESHGTWPMSVAELQKLIGECTAEFTAIHRLRRRSIPALPPPGE